jgi:hypothetical protein
MQFTHLAGRKPIANYEADVMPNGRLCGRRWRLRRRLSTGLV